MAIDLIHDFGRYSNRNTGRLRECLFGGYATRHGIVDHPRLRCETLRAPIATSRALAAARCRHA
eukprot:13080993-Alexandrium_andersonii.AAC.1